MLRNTARLARKANFVAVTLKGKVASVQFHGPTGNDLTRTGNIGIWNVVRWCETAQLIAEDTPNPVTGSVFLDMEKIRANRLVFAASLKCTAGEDLYKLVDVSEPTPFSVEIGISNIGNSSVGYSNSVVDKSGRELARSVKQFVYVDETSRKPVPLPDWWKRKHASFAGEDKKLVLPVLSVPAENTYKYSIKVSWNDIDEYYHVNYMSYVMYCFDAAMDAVKHRFYAGFHGDIFNYNVKTLQVNYINEAVGGDTVTVVTWQDVVNPRIIHFSIEREGNALVQCSMEFFMRANL